MISAKTAKQRVEYSKKNGLEKTLEHFQIAHDTLRRYINLISEPNEEPTLPKILVLDIETSPILLFAWQLFKPRPNHTDIFQDWHIFSWAAKWLLDDQMYSDVLTPKEAKAHTDSRVCKSLWQIVDDADIIIAHNGKSFDIRKFNARFMLNGLKPPSPYSVIDTLTESRKMAMHTTHRLDYLSKLFGGTGKIENEKGLWQKCFAGDAEALLKMEALCSTV